MSVRTSIQVFPLMQETTTNWWQWLWLLYTNSTFLVACCRQEPPVQTTDGQATRNPMIESYPTHNYYVHWLEILWDTTATNMPPPGVVPGPPGMEAPGGGYNGSPPGMVPRLKWISSNIHKKPLLVYGRKVSTMGQVTVQTMPIRRCKPSRLRQRKSTKPHRQLDKGFSSLGFTRLWKGLCPFCLPQQQLLHQATYFFAGTYLPLQSATRGRPHNHFKMVFKWFLNHLRNHLKS